MAFPKSTPTQMTRTAIEHHKGNSPGRWQLSRQGAVHIKHEPLPAVNAGGQHDEVPEPIGDVLLALVGPVLVVVVGAVGVQEGGGVVVVAVLDHTAHQAEGGVAGFGQEDIDRVGGKDGVVVAHAVPVVQPHDTIIFSRRGEGKGPGGGGAHEFLEATSFLLLLYDILHRESSQGCWTIQHCSANFES